MPGSVKITWTEFWGLAAQVDDKQRQDWFTAIGFYVDENRQEVYASDELKRILDNCSVNELAEFLSGAPTLLVKVYLHKLPVKYAKQVMSNFRKADHAMLDDAYRNPPELVGVVK